MRISDWSSDVCSSDLPAAVPDRARRPAGRLPHLRPGLSSVQAAGNPAPRSGEMNMKKTISLLGLPLLAIATMPLAQAEVQGVAPLLKQARYWQSKGRGDLARQAYNRELAIHPSHACARPHLSGNTPPNTEPGRDGKGGGT